MYFNKSRHPSNFRFCTRREGDTLRFGARQAALRLRDLGEDVFHVELSDPERWPLDARLVRMFDDAFDGASWHALQIDAQGDLRLVDERGQAVLAGIGAASLGVCGSAWLVQFERHAGMRFYGQGEKVTGLEKTGRRTRFWNADVFADHAMPVIVDGQPDPQYASIPYLLVYTGQAWIGLLVDHPGAAFMDTGSNWFFSGRDDLAAPASFWFGADEGVPAFYVIAGDDPASVTRRLQRLVGTTPLPPLWALGHHQCRWGYTGTQDLLALDEAFRAHEFPCDGLWLDIDYMDRYKVFTTSRQHFGDVRADLEQLHERGRRVVPILDPGVKVEPGDPLAQSGLDAGIFCLNPEGEPYVGFVWPGRTWFPDFSLPEGRAWWAAQVRDFRELGFDGAWIDMNDPATGAAELDDMRFQRGQWPHGTYHNVYGTGMAEATRAGFEAARPEERAFVLSRSASTGASRWTAVWTGDNWSNWHHLRTCIHGTLNLALSGLPFNGPDVPGFGGNADRELAIAWYKVCFLFPFLRNHSSLHSVRQEPWAFGAETLEIVRHYVRLRYKFLPYLYQLWVAQAADGSAVLRPLLHDFGMQEGLGLDQVDDQFLVGPDILQAPLVHLGQQRRLAVLPGAGRWLDAGSGQFLPGGRVVPVHSAPEFTPMFLREASLLPLQPGERRDQDNNLADIELHAVLGRDCTDEATLLYVADDGHSQSWRDGARSRHALRARRQGDTLHLYVDTLAQGWRPLRLRVVGYDGADTVHLHSKLGTTIQSLAPHRWRCSGEPLDLSIGPEWST